MKRTLPSSFFSWKTPFQFALTAFFLLCLGQTNGFSQEIFHYTTLTSGAGTTALNASSTPLTRGNPDIKQATDCMADQGFGSHGWPTTTTFNVNTFNTNGWYVEVTITPNANYDLKITGFSSKARRENQTGLPDDGPLAMRYGYKKDGGGWTTVNPGNPQSSNVCNSGGTLRSWNPGVVDVNNTITFRVYGLSSGANFTGDLFLRELIVEGYVCSEDPTITLDLDESDLAICAGVTSATLAYSAEDGDLYAINYEDAGFTDVPTTALANAPNSISLSIPANTPPGIYNGTLTISNHCDDTHDYPFSVVVLPLPAAQIVVAEESGTFDNDGRLCEGDAALLTASGGGTYLWSNGETNAAISTSTAGTYTVTVTGTNGCTASATATIYVSPLPVPEIIVEDESGNDDNDGVLCAGDAATLTASGGGTYEWSTGSTNAAITVTLAGEYSVTVTSTDGCTAVTSTTITVNPLPVAEIDVEDESGNDDNDGVLCAGDDATLTASGGATYEWSTGSTNATINVTSAGEYTVTVTSAEGCTTATSMTITVNPLPEAVISVEDESGNDDNDGIICAGGSATLTASGGVIYEWSNGSTSASIEVTPDETTIYVVTVTSDDGCTAQASISIIVNPLPNAAITEQDNSGNPNDHIICAGDAAFLTATGGGTYAWSTAETTATIIVGYAETFTVTVTSADGCVAAASASITVSPLPVAEIDIDEDAGTPDDGVICAGGDVTLTASGGATYLWSNGDTDAATTVTEAGDYTVTVTSIDGCTATASVTITVNPQFTASIDDAPTCLHLGAELQLSGSTNIVLPATQVTATWSDDGSGFAEVDGDGLVSGENAGGSTVIYYTVTDNGGCVSTASHNINVLNPVELVSTVEDEQSSFACGELIKICVTANNFCDLSGLVFSVNWDENAFDFVGYELADPLSSADVNLPFFSNGDLEFQWFGDPLTLDDGDGVICYTLRAKDITGDYEITLSGGASNSYYSAFPVLANDIELDLVPLSLETNSPLAICPGQETVTLSLSDVVGLPDSYDLTFTDPAFSDVADGSLTIVDGEGQIIIELPSGLAPGPYDAILVVSNEYGCVSAEYEIQVIMDNIAPDASIDPEAPTLFTCIDEVPDAPNLSVVLVGEDADNCTPPEDLVIVLESVQTYEGSGCASDPITITRTYSVTDEAGNTSYVTQIITVIDDVAPVISDEVKLKPWYSSPDDILDHIADLLVNPALFSDNCDQNPTYEVEMEAVVDPSCGQIVTITVTDICGNENVYVFETIIDFDNPTVANAEPIAPCYPNAADAQEAAIAAVTEVANDDCTDPIDLVITSSITDNQDCDQTITVTVKDACGKTSTVVYNVRIDGEGPTITSETDALDGNCYTSEQAAIDAAIQATEASDGCPGDLVYTTEVEGDCDASITVTVTDGCENSSSITYTGLRIDEEDPALDPAVTITCYQSVAEAIAGLAAQSNPSDNCSSLEELLESVEGEFVSDDDEAPCNIGTVILTFSDGCGNIVTAEYSGVTIDNTDPELVSFPPVDPSHTCFTEVAAPDPDAVEATDNCSSVTVTWISDVVEGTCANSGVINRTYRLTDACGNTKDFVQVINVSDDVAPTWYTPVGALDATVECDDAYALLMANLASPVAEDNCGEFSMSGPEVSTVTSTDCTEDGFVSQITRTWYATDECGNVSTAYTQVITIVDTHAPYWETSPEALNVTLQCDDLEGLDDAQAMSPIPVDACDGTLTPVEISGEFVVGACPQSGTYTNTWTVKDDCGNISITYTQVITVEDTQAPSVDFGCQFMPPLSLFTSQGADCPSEATISLEVNDVIHTTLNDTWTVAGITIPSLNGCVSDNCSSDENINVRVISINESNDVQDLSCAHSITVTFEISDACGNVVSQLFQCQYLIIDDELPYWDQAANDLNVTLECGDETGLAAALAQAPTASDECDENVSVELNETDDVNVTCDEDEHYVRRITRTWTATDCALNSASVLYTQVITIEDTTPPVIADVQTIGTCYNEISLALEDAENAVSAVATDACSENLDYQTNFFYGDNCSVTITVVVSDPCGNSSSYSFVTRIDSEGPEPTQGVISNCYPTQAAAEAAALTATSFEDNCPGALTVTASTAGVCPATITVMAIDGCGNTTSVVYENICIDNTPPNITTPASDMTVECSPALQSQFQAWVNNHGGAVATPPVTWSTIPANPTLSGGCSGGTTVTFVASDQCGNTSTTSATFTYDDDTAPTASNPPTLNLTCINDVPAPNPDVVVGEMDNCDASLTVTLFANTFMGPVCSRTYVRTYSVTDDCGNSTLVTQTINVVDNVAPTFTAPGPATVNVNASCVYDASPGITGDVTNEHDNCATGLNATYTDVVEPGTGLQNKFKITRTWVLSDDCGNSATAQVQIITVKDVTAPTITGCPTNVSLTGSIMEGNCGAFAGSLTNPAIDDNCEGELLTYAFTGVTMGSGNGYVPNTTVYAEGATIVTYTVTDAVGNTATCSFTVSVNCLSVAGRIIWEHDDVSGVKDVTVKLSQGVNVLGTDLSDTNGDYDFFIAAPGLYRITPVKNINRLNGVTSADATRIQQHIANNPPILDPYKKVCADVNHNGTISSQDANVIIQAIAGNPLALSIFNVFWRFTPTTYPMPDPTPLLTVPAFPEFKDVTVNAVDVTGVNFFGMKIGDVEMGWANPQMAPSIPPLVWMLQDQMLEAGKEVELTFDASNFNDLAAYQFALDFDPTQLQFVGFEPLGAIPMTSDNFGAFDANLGELRTAWAMANGATLTDGTAVFRAKFKVLASGQMLSQVLRLDESAMECQAYSEALVPTKVKLVFAETVGADSPLDPSHAALQLMQNRPNPFTDATTIGFILPEACDAQIRILDVSGRELTAYNRTYTAGYHELDFRMENAASYGLLFCELTTPQGKRVIKMMAAR